MIQSKELYEKGQTRDVRMIDRSLLSQLRRHTALQLC